MLGTGHYSDNGGKGANQAVAAARLGGAVAMFGLVGDDDFGAKLLADLSEEGIDVTGVMMDEGTGTGLAVITVDDAAQNTIVVSPGANAALSPDHLLPHLATIADASALLLQFEVPGPAIITAAEACHGIVCLNPAPAQPLTASLLDHIDVLTPNRTELLTLSGVDAAESADELAHAVARLEFAGAVVVTLGAEGALVVDGGSATPVAAPEVVAVDPTGSGDAFCGALGLALGEGRSLVEATSWAVAAGAVAATRRGAQASMPTRQELERLLD